MTSNNENKLLTKSDINKVFWRSFTVNASFNYERQMNQGAQYALSPILRKLYPDKKELGEALQRHAEFFNTPISEAVSTRRTSLSPMPMTTSMLPFLSCPTSSALSPAESPFGLSLSSR